MGENKHTLQVAVDTVCEFLEIKSVVVESKDTLDSLTDKIEKESSSFAQDIEAFSIDYSPLKLKNILNAVMIKYGCEQVSEKIVDDDILRSLYPIGVKALHMVLASLSHDYCANRCHITKHEFRCCEGNSHKLDFNDIDVLMLQETEAKRSNKMQIHNTYMGCRYLNTKSGCTLKISKSPACIGFICGPLDSYIRKIAPANAVTFINAMNNVIDPTFDKIMHDKIVAFDLAVHYGKMAVEEKNGR